MNGRNHWLVAAIFLSNSIDAQAKSQLCMEPTIFNKIWAFKAFDVFCKQRFRIFAEYKTYFC